MKRRDWIRMSEHNEKLSIYPNVGLARSNFGPNLWGFRGGEVARGHPRPLGWPRGHPRKDLGWPCGQPRFWGGRAATP
jgi:hypothetical protein